MARRLVTFHLDRHWCGIDVETVQEVASFNDLTRVPLAQDAVVGLANLRGHIMTVLDLRRTLELGPMDGAPSRKAVVLDDADGSIALLVDRAAGVVEVSEDDFEPPPETLRGPVRERILGAFKLPDGLLLVLNLRGVLEAVGRGDGTDPEGDDS
ncbi:MAG: purine-binding chemotaxis protein CheW [Acidobacteria bacterium]|nr:purine-binding chemotaxis protein CheW [Acidobacteriota bacterium]